MRCVTALLNTDELVGCRIKGVSGIIEDLPNYLRIHHGPFQLSVIFLPFRGAAEDEETRGIINQLAKAAADREMTLEPA